MELSEKVQAVLHRCKLMNCINEGQAVSIGSFESGSEGREDVTATIESMVASELMAKGTKGTYLLTSAGAAAISAAVFTPKSHLRSMSKQYGRPPINKLQ